MGDRYTDTKALHRDPVEFDQSKYRSIQTNKKRSVKFIYMYGGEMMRIENQGRDNVRGQLVPRDAVQVADQISEYLTRGANKGRSRDRFSPDSH